MILCFKVQGLGFFGAGSFFRVQGCGLYGLGCGVYCGLVALRIHRSSSATSASASRKPRTIATCTSRMIAMQVSAAVLSGASAVPYYNYSIMDPNALLKKSLKSLHYVFLTTPTQAEHYSTPALRRIRIKRGKQQPLHEDGAHGELYPKP